MIEDGIDYGDLNLFDWQKWEGTYLADQALSVKEQLQSHLVNKIFPREDTKELLILVLIWIGAPVADYQFHYPGAVSHARFLMQSNYSMKITLLSKQIDFYSSDEIEQIKGVAFFIGLFYTSWYFKCFVPSVAPMLHLTTISQMKKFQEFFPDVATTVLDSINLHLWYITPQSIPLALIDEGLAVEQRKNNAQKLSEVARPTVLPMGKPSFPDLSAWPDRL